MYFHKISFIIATIFTLTSCVENDEPIEAETTAQESLPVIPTPEFNADSAYFFIQNQVDFGPRVPNTSAHDSCAAWLEDKLNEYTSHIIIQRGEVSAYDGRKLSIRNIIAQFSPEIANRVMLCAHWDSRPFADMDNERQYDPIDGANDGASGVGVLLEVARNINQTKPYTGIDIIFFDAEDYGKSKVNNSFCLGAQYWAKNPPIKSYYAHYAILLDMVGAKNAIFSMEGYSMQYAPGVVKKVWDIAAHLGYSSYFVYKKTSPMTDDHYYINTLAHIPTIDVIHHDHSTRSGFPPFWHTHDDNMDNIDRQTLKAVGQTLLEVIYKE